MDHPFNSAIASIEIELFRSAELLIHEDGLLVESILLNRNACQQKTRLDSERSVRKKPP